MIIMHGHDIYVFVLFYLCLMGNRIDVGIYCCFHIFQEKGWPTHQTSILVFLTLFK